MAKLKSCPFCGGNVWEYIQNSGLVIACHTCKAQISRVLLPAGDWESAVHKCRQAWNTRVPLESAEGRRHG